jgi:hypothetical protein
MCSCFAATSGTDVNTDTRERPGVSAFVLEDEVVYHSYSAYSRGVDSRGACINGSIARPKDATNMATSGGSAAMSTRPSRSRIKTRQGTAAIEV